MKQIEQTKYYVLPDGSVVRPLKPRLKGNIRYWNLCINGKLKAFSQKTLIKLYEQNNG
jgi:hypothetical protein